MTFLRRLFSVGMLILSLSAAAVATPILPDLEKLLSQPHSVHEGFTPARAGWEGSEADSSTFLPSNTALEEFGPEETARAARTSFFAAAIPDLRIWACLCILILLLRRLKRRTQMPGVSGASNSGASEDRRAA